MHHHVRSAFPGIRVRFVLWHFQRRQVGLKAGDQLRYTFCCATFCVRQGCSLERLEPLIMTFRVVLKGMFIRSLFREVREYFDTYVRTLTS